ncbi:MAG: hypothetical protein JWM19_4080 [Actinomycetia bacterium]|nr:hypothetical protein [Actinomycetes bacterium]
MPHLSVRTRTMPTGNAFASPVLFDFTDDVGQGEQILGYAVGMSGFLLNYVTNSDYWAENAGTVAASLTPNLLGNVIVVGGNVLLTDYDGDSARDFPDGSKDPASVAQVTALAVIGTSLTTTVCGTAFGLTTGKDSQEINISNNTNLAFLSGFSVAGTGGDAGEIGGLTLTSSVSSPYQDQVTVNGTTSLSNFPTTGTVDVGILSYGSDLEGFDVQPATVKWGDPNGVQGMTGTFLNTFTIPAPYSQIANAAILLQGVTIHYGDTANFELIEAMQPSGLSIDGDQVSGAFTLNMFNPDFGARTYISRDSTAALSVIVQFA